MSILIWLLILKIVLALVAAGSFVFFFFAVCSIYTNLTTGIPWAKIPKENIDKIFKEIDLPKNSLIYDLGAGDGRVILAAEKFGFRARGFELSLYPYLEALWQISVSHSRAEVKRRDFYKENLNQADAVFIFLTGKALIRLEGKLKRELKQGATVISYGFALPGWQPQKTIFTNPSLTYVYRI
ncbi:MAG: hypothetical protein WCV70_02430 [Patescibacteria group bacterium]|jgi:hypothetical protein